MFRVLSDNIRMLLGSGSDAVVVMDVEEVIHYWNSQAEAIFGWPPEEAIGQHLSIILPEELHGGKHRMYVKRVLESGALRTKGLIRYARGHEGRRRQALEGVVPAAGSNRLNGPPAVLQPPDLVARLLFQPPVTAFATALEPTPPPLFSPPSLKRTSRQV